MEWLQIMRDKSLSDLPYKIELNEWGHIEMSPASNLHGMLQSRIVFLLNGHTVEGQVLVECSILTARNVKVADVAWGSSAFFEANGFETPYPVAPEICVEVLSASNSMEEMMMKKNLYLAKGAKEFWICGEDGGMEFHGRDGAISASALCPDFPKNVRTDRTPRTESSPA